ncbi:CBS domain-containing protein [Actinopolymorpha pittospori]|uniref:CBS domain-containing protein n=1 Tax=Actinopolymorpha pittospori TaxID=648752 RepID=A0A927MYG3_9ACTN|nr:CBS domain-containing protein [Actinopolymorpha pittospori]
MDQSPIVVGVDGSAASAAALRWGVAEAERLRLPVEAVFAVPEERRDEGEIDPDALLTALIQTAVPPTWRRRQPLSHRVSRGEPASVLTEQSRRASFLVLGRRRGRDPLRTSTTSRCLRNAACPVAVVPANIPELGVPTAGESSAQAYGGVGDRPVGDVMTPNVPGVDAGSGVDVALRLMVGAGVHHLPVMEHDHCVGLLSETDAVWHLASWSVHDRPPTARDLVREPPPVVPSDHTVREAATALLLSGGDAVLVADEGRIVGLLTSDEVATLLAEEPTEPEAQKAPRSPATPSPPAPEGDDRDAR